MPGGYDYAKFAVLYVDDEDKSLKYFRREYGDEFRVITCANADEALAILAEKGDGIGVLLSDQRMPGVTGVELLDRVRDEWPGVVRILVTAYTDLTSAVDAVNRGEVYRYVSKPWNTGELRILLRRAMELFVLQLERHVLLHEKLTIVQRMLMLDRGRYLLAAATCLRPLVRGAPGALRSFLENMPDEALTAVRPEPIDQIADRDPLSLADDDARSTGARLGSVLSAIVGEDPGGAYLEFEELDMCELAKAAAAEEDDVIVECPNVAVMMRGHRGMLVRSLSVAFECLSALGGAGNTTRVGVAPVVLSADRRGGRLTIRNAALELGVGQLAAIGGGVLDETEADGGPGLLPLWFASYHHGGTVTIEREDPNVAAITITLPCDPPPADAIEDDFDVLAYLAERANDRHVLP